MSLSRRLLFTTTAVLVIAFGTTIALLDYLFRETSENSIRQLLEVQAYSILGLINAGPTGELTMPDELPEARLSSLGSGLYAEIRDAAGAQLWRSDSSTGLTIAGRGSLATGQLCLARRNLEDGTEALVFGIGVEWELAPGFTRKFDVYTGEDLTAYLAELNRFRGQLLTWFVAIMATLLVAVALTLRWGLKPVRQMASEIAEIESSERERLSSGYPVELAGVARNLNALVASDRQRITRYRNTMQDLAHSIKSPIAAMRGELRAPEPDQAILAERVDRIHDVVDYELRKAAAVGPRVIGAQPVDVRGIVDEVVTGLMKIYADKNVQCRVDVDRSLTIRAEQGDVYELFGNLLDNAFKWCRGHVSVRAGTVNESLRIAVEDDGPGIAKNQVEKILERGGRADESTPGQGIGLAVVGEIVELYRGELNVGRSDAGGATIDITLPID